MPKVIVQDSKGREIEVDESSVPYMEQMGYKPYVPEEQSARAFRSSVEEEYGGAKGTAIAAASSFVDAATFSLWPESDAERYARELHPVADTVAGIAGAVVPAIASGGTGAVGAAARLTPAGWTAAKGMQAGAAVAKGRVGQLAVAGAIEGVGASTGALVASAIAGDPVTSEAVVGELGAGFLLGLGAGVLGAGLEKAATRFLRKASDIDASLTKAEAKDLAENPLYKSPEAYQYEARIGRALDDAKKGLEKRGMVAQAEYDRWDELFSNSRPRDEAGLPANPFHTRNPEMEAKFGRDTGMRNKALEDVVAAEEAMKPGNIRVGRDTVRELDVSDSQVVGARPVTQVVDEADIVGSRAVTQQVDEADILKELDAKNATQRVDSLGGKTYRDPDVVPQLPPKALRGVQRVGADDIIEEAPVAGSPQLDLPLGTPAVDAADNLGKTGAWRMADAAGDIGKKLQAAAKDRAAVSTAKRLIDKLPPLNLANIAKMGPSEIGELAVHLEQIATHAPDAARALTAEFRGALGAAAPKLGDWNAMDVIGYKAAGEFNKKAVEALAGSGREVKELVGLWAVLRSGEGEWAKRAAKNAAKESVSAADRAVQNRLGGAVGRAGQRIAGALVGGAALGSGAGHVVGWALSELVMKGAAGGMAKTVARAKQRALVATAKGLGMAKGPGRPAAIVRLNAKEKLETPLSAVEQDAKEARKKQTEQDLLQERIDDVIFAASSAGREALADTLAPLRAQSPELADSLMQDHIGRMSYLAKYAPRKPPWAAAMRRFPYPEDQVQRFAEVYRAVTQPQSVLDDFAVGRLSPDAAAAFRATSPGLAQMVTQFVMEHFDPNEADYPTRFGVSVLTDVPFDPTLQLVSTLQANHTKPEPTGLNLGSAGTAADDTMTPSQRVTN